MQVRKNSSHARTSHCALPGILGAAALLCGAVLPLGGRAAGGAGQERAAGAEQFGYVTESRLLAAGERSAEWLTGGHDWRGTYYSPLSTIDTASAGRVGLAWQYELGVSRGQEATPIVVDGVLYVSTNWGQVVALDAASGRLIWSYDPEVDGQWGRYACCDVVNRGVSVWKGVVYVGSTDNYLHAVDAKTGRRRWKVDILDADARARHTPYTTSGAPQIAGDVVVIGNGGADFGVRGFVRAFDTVSGARRWVLWTVPHDPVLGVQETPQLTAALKSWDPKSNWRWGGGGTAWDGMAYDPTLKLLYVGTGNASPYNYQQRSNGRGDNLYLASILAIDPATGELKWHYQTVPGERWDYTATQKMILADLSIDGRMRQVLMQAPKNGFFYVLDRATGELISAKPYVYQNWAKYIDPTTHKAVVDDATSDYTRGPKLIYPSMAGAHNWQPMSFNPTTGLVYIPVIDMPMVYIDTEHRRAGEIQGTFDVLGVPPESYAPSDLDSLAGRVPAMTRLVRTAGGPDKPTSKGFLRAWDPVRGRVVWEQPTATFWDGGVLSTAGNLVISGDATGRLNIRRADDGGLLKSIETGVSIMAAPMTYEINGAQYIAVLGGLGGGGGGQFALETAAYKYGNAGRILTFKLGGKPVPLPQPLPLEKWDAPPSPAPFEASDAAAGEVLANRYCGRCHGSGRGEFPDLRRLPRSIQDALPDIVLGGALQRAGMGSFADVLKPDDLIKIRAYIAREQLALYAEETKDPSPPRAAQPSSQ